MSFSHVQRIRILYKTILRLHRGLPEELQILGTKYTKEEFKRHKNCSKHEEKIFLDEWTKYTLTLAEQLGIQGPKTDGQVGIPLTQKDLEHLRDEQIMQLYELMKETTQKE